MTSSQSIFFITGLPRSRTSWLANLFTSERSFCFHEKLAEGLKAQVLIEAIDLQLTRGYSHVGAAETAIVPFVPEIIAAFPAARWVRINRSVAEACYSFRKYFGDEPAFRDGPALTAAAAQPAFADMAAYQLGLSQSVETYDVEFDQLEEEEVVQRLWEFCAPSLPWQSDRYQLLNNLSVQMIPGKRKLWASSPE